MIFSDKEIDKTRKRMDRLDAIIHEYLRSQRKTMDYISERYSRRIEYFQKMPLEILGGVCRYANVSNEDLRYILGLPTGKADEN